MLSLTPENQRKRAELIAQGCRVDMHEDGGKFYCHVEPRRGDLPPVYKDTPDEAFETAYSNYTQGTGRLGG
jgi:hypothetical protein